MLDIVFGKKSDPRAVEALVETLKPSQWSGTLYVGYPVFATDGNSAITDALLTTKEHGVIIFDLSSHEFIDLPPGELVAAVKQRQRELRRQLNSRLVAYEDLVGDDGVTLAFKIHVITFLPNPIPDVEAEEISHPGNVLEKIKSSESVSEHQFTCINAAIQKTAALKPKKKRLNVHKDDSMGALIKSLEAQIANLDKWQKNAAIESPEGPQRIRGLAGSGKTIILALKAAYLHANDPLAEIIVTFNSRSLYQQFKNLIRRFYFDQVFDEPDWSKLKVLHAWGSSTEPGVYSTISAASGATPLTFGTARYKYGYSSAFQGVCQELVSHLKKTQFKPIYDYVLIDEAQDFPSSFFQLIYSATKQPKHIVWAYDELQNLNDSSMPTLDQLFGVGADGVPIVEISNNEGQPQQDILLPICYRNPPWILSLALGLGLGIKRPNSEFAQMFSEPDLWKEIGYFDVNGNLELGQPVRLRRSSDRSAGFFAQTLDPRESVTWHTFEERQLQSEWIANDIQRVMLTQELDANDILVVIPDAIHAPKIGAEISEALIRRNIKSHIIGVTGSRDIVFIDDSVAISGIYRAKGNEAPLVYIASAEYCHSPFDTSKKRNMLFTAITRAKAWVRICGVGREMQQLAEEINAIAADKYDLVFTYPTLSKIKEIKSAYKERTAKEKRAVRHEIASTEKLLQRILNGEINLDELPEGLADLLKRGLQ